MLAADKPDGRKEKEMQDKNTGYRYDRFRDFQMVFPLGSDHHHYQVNRYGGKQKQNKSAMKRQSNERKKKRIGQK